MSEAAHTLDLVLLGQAGYAAAAIWAQVEKLKGSKAFDGLDRQREILDYLVQEALKGRVPNQETVAQRFGSTGATFARTSTSRVRDQLEEYRLKEAKRGEILLEILPKSYLVVAPRHIAGASVLDMPAAASIIEPEEDAYVYSRVLVRGRTDALDPDLRLWLVVLAPDGIYYPQGRISRRSPFWESEVRIGRMTWGESDGFEFSILLVAADLDSDFDFHGYMKRNGDGYGTRLPSDTTVLDIKRILRRDIRPKSKTSAPPPLKSSS